MWWRVREMSHSKDSTCHCWLWRWRKGAVSRSAGLASRSWKSFLPQSLQKGLQSWLNLDFTQRDSCQTSDVQNCKVIHLCFMLLSLWHSTSDAIRSEYFCLFTLIWTTLNNHVRFGVEKEISKFKKKKQMRLSSLSNKWYRNSLTSLNLIKFLT